MSNQQQVHSFLKEHRSKAYCDHCIAEAIRVDPFEVTLTTSAMRLFPEEFTQQKGMCVGCNFDGKIVTSAI